MVIRTQLTVQEVEDLLRRHLKTVEGFWAHWTFWATTDLRRLPEFVGWVGGGAFRLRPLAGFVGTRAYRPVLIGRIIQTHQGTEVRVATRLWIGDAITLAPLLGFVIFAAVTFKDIRPALGFGLFFAVTGGVQWAFEAGRARRLLLRVLNQPAP